LCLSHNFINRQKNAHVLGLLQVKKALNKKKRTMKVVVSTV
jgi:hypothetical protein